MKRSWTTVYEIVRKAEGGTLITRPGDVSAVQSIISSLTPTQRGYLFQKLQPHLTYEGLGALFNNNLPSGRPVGAQS
jgi:hypothetical protein